MTPGENKNEELYDFFEKIERYIIDGKSIEDNIPTGEPLPDCNSFSDYWGNKYGNKKMAKIICNKLISIYKKLKNESSNYSRDINYKKDFAFLTYWVNWKIYGEFYEKISVSEFYDLIGSYVQLDSGYELTNTHVFEIDKDVLNKLNILYNLYKNYSKLNSIKYTNSEQNNEVLTLSTACCTDYIKVSYICNGDNKKNNPNFCKKLDDFKSKYDDLDKHVVARGSDYSDYFIKLSECPNPKIITTAITGSIIGLIPLVGILYKFTPMGQVLRSKIGILNNDISNTDEAMTNISLIEKENEPLRFKQGTYNIKYQSL